jgi:formate hydrogenlyase transcriptional activator
MMHERVHPEDSQQYQRWLNESTKRHGCDLEARVQGNDGAYHWYLHHMTRVEDQRGTSTEWNLTRVDIEKYKREREGLERQNAALRREVEMLTMSESIVGQSLPALTMLAQLEQAAETDAAVLLRGERGTGKEFAARVIHKRSLRASHPFVRVNCAALHRDLISSELFGYEKAVFTGAHQQHWSGDLEVANGGTIFLDEICELPMDTQLELARVLKTGESHRPGSDRARKIDVRVIAATHREPMEAVKSGALMRDLWECFGGFPLDIPSLRERRDDIRLLAEYFANRYSARAGKRISRIDENSLRDLEEYSWPGNIRELRNLMERCVIACEGDTLFRDDVALCHDPRKTSKSMNGFWLQSDLPHVESASAARQHC